VTSTDKVVATNVVNAKPLYFYAPLVVLVLVMTAGFYYFWQQLLLRDHQQRNFQQLMEGVERSQDKLIQQGIKDQQALQALVQEQLVQFDLRIEKLSSGDRSDWLLAETEYLLRMANQYATLAQDAKSAETLLANADQVIRELEKNIAASKAVVNIRRKIADERAALRLRSEVDKEELYLQLEAMINQVDQMAVVDIGSMSKKSPLTEENIVSHQQSISSQMMASFLRALEKIGGYIRVQNHEQEIGPLLSPDEQQYLKQNLRLRLEQAQIAVLQHRQTVYVTSLNDARDWIKKYYMIDPALKNKLLLELETYSKKNIEAPLPDISGSLTALRGYMLTRHVFNEKQATH
jgi:uroporphyrin-3 C-methyltransferase